FSRSGGLVSARAVNRTATFVFYIGDRYYGVVSASVLGKNVDRYSFTSALPVALLKLLAPALNARPQTQQKSEALARSNSELTSEQLNRLAVPKRSPISGGETSDKSPLAETVIRAPWN
ncbi:MAG TPA: hypothetical protein VHP35_14530, partial [Terriglobia bacterium]|nr:hypothetical protein [Terriglobia bacterium]